MKTSVLFATLAAVAFAAPVAAKVAEHNQPKVEPAAAAKPADRCRDSKGKFAKCPAPAAKQVCKDAKGKFAKCGAPGAKPVG